MIEGMKYPALLAVISPLLLTGCGGDPPVPNKVSQQTADITLPKPTNATPKSAEPKSAEGKPQTATIPNNIPAGARYTIVCDRFSGPGHEQQARLNKEKLIKLTGKTEFYVVHEELYSMLMYGYYTEIEHHFNAKESERAATDRKWLESLTSNTGQKFFRSCLAIPLPQLDPVGPIEWDLSRLDADKPLNDPKRKYWTVVVAAYTAQGMDELKRPINYKQAAVDSVKNARAQGLEAYYYFGDGISQVCIGAWPRSAVKEQEKAAAGSKEKYGGSRSSSEIYVSTTPLSEAERKRIESRGNVKVFAPKVEVVDPSLLQTLEKFSEYAVNSEVMVDKESGKSAPSFLAEIPEMQPSLVSGVGENSSNLPASNNPSTPPNLLNPQQGGSGTSGRLRSAQ